jgi:hypothetical protein
MTQKEFKEYLDTLKFNEISGVFDNSVNYYKGQFLCYKRLPRKLKKKLKNYDTERI